MIRAPWPFSLGFNLFLFNLVTPFEVYTILLRRMYGSTACSFDWRLFYRLMQMGLPELYFVAHLDSVFSMGGELYQLWA